MTQIIVERLAYILSSATFRQTRARELTVERDRLVLNIFS